MDASSPSMPLPPLRKYAARYAVTQGWNTDQKLTEDRAAAAVAVTAVAPAVAVAFDTGMDVATAAKPAAAVAGGWGWRWPEASSWCSIWLIWLWAAGAAVGPAAPAAAAAAATVACGAGMTDSTLRTAYAAARSALACTQQQVVIWLGNKPS